MTRARCGPERSRWPSAELAADLSCTSGVEDARHDPVLLVPGTALDPEASYSWNYELELSVITGHGGDVHSRVA